MKILVLGSDGYIGYPLTLKLLKAGHEVLGVDSYVRRKRVQELGSNSVTPILSPAERRDYLKRTFPNFIGVENFSLGTASPAYIKPLLKNYYPDTIVHLAEQPSAPWSMRSIDECRITQRENVIGTLDLLWTIYEACPDAHLVKLGTMGEYGTPNCDIPEGKIPERCLGGYDQYDACPMSGLMFPRTAGSFYHLSKVHDTHNIEFACRNWGLTSTDIMQGVVFGVKVTGLENHNELTRFDYDECFGTAINRFCAQAISEMPITPYGKGQQVRGFLPLKDSIQCLYLVITNPPEPGTYRTLNQYESTYSINSLATMVANAAREHGLSYKISNIPNPRKELESHYYNPSHQALFDLGYLPSMEIEYEISELIHDLIPFKDRVSPAAITPKTNWVKFV